MHIKNSLDHRVCVSSLGLSAKELQFLQATIFASRLLDGGFKYVEPDNLHDVDFLLLAAADKRATEFYLKNYMRLNCRLIVVHQDNIADFLYQYPELSNCTAIETPMKLSLLAGLLKKLASTDNQDQAFAAKNQGKLHKLNVLVADDSFRVREHLATKMAELLRQQNDSIELNICFAASGKEAVAKLRQAKGRCDLVLVDNLMQDFSGFQMCKWIKASTKKIKVAVLTAKISPLEKMRGSMAGCDGYLSKPPQESEIRRALSLAL